MNAVILAAGAGIRLNGLSGGDPKCLLKVGGMSLIERQIAALGSNGIADIVAVIGCRAERVRQVCGSGCSYVINDRYGDTNSMYSLWLAREYLKDGFIVVNADVLFDSRLLRNLIAHPAEDALLFEPQQVYSAPLGYEEMKVRIESERVIEISKSIDPTRADGESLGIAKFGSTGAMLILEHLNRLVSEERFMEWVPRVFQEFLSDRSIVAIPTGGLPWIEIDFPDDYIVACSEIYPRMKSADSKKEAPFQA